MEREQFAKVMQEVLDSLPEEFRSRISNVAVLVEDFPPGQTPSSHPKQLLPGLFHGIPMTKKSVFNLPTGPDYVVLYQKNIASGVTQNRPCRVTSKPAMLEGQDRSLDWGADSLSWHEQCLEQNEAAAGDCAGAAGLVAAAD